MQLAGQTGAGKEMLPMRIDLGFAIFAYKVRVAYKDLTAKVLR